MKVKWLLVLLFLMAACPFPAAVSAVDADTARNEPGDPYYLSSDEFTSYALAYGDGYHPFVNSGSDNARYFFTDKPDTDYPDRAVGTVYFRRNNKDYACGFYDSRTGDLSITQEHYQSSKKTSLPVGEYNVDDDFVLVFDDYSGIPAHGKLGALYGNTYTFNEYVYSDGAFLSEEQVTAYKALNPAPGQDGFVSRNLDIFAENFLETFSAIPTKLATEVAAGAVFIIGVLCAAVLLYRAVRWIYGEFMWYLRPIPEQRTFTRDEQIIFSHDYDVDGNTPYHMLDDPDRWMGYDGYHGDYDEEDVPGSAGDPDDDEALYRAMESYLANGYDERDDIDFEDYMDEYRERYLDGD